MVDLSLYFHIPFCSKKCHYCHFYVIPDNESHKEKYMASLKKEWDSWSSLVRQSHITSIYFGGGTPALIGPKAISEIIQWVQSVTPLDFKNLEITLEANPENVSHALMREFALAGVNRVSLGVQTLNDSLLKKLGRTHSAQRSVDAVLETYRAGIENITLDLMYDLPLQDLSIWQDTLNKVVALPIKHVSLYNLTVEPHTVFFKHQQQILKEVPDEDTSLRMYESAVETLQAHGFLQYEISAFSQPGWPSRHNCGYWTGRAFIGMGPSAFSYMEGRRFRNIANLNRYCSKFDAGESPVDFEEKLEPLAALRENLAIQLRLVEGVDLGHFEARCGKLDEQTLNTLRQLEQQGLISLMTGRAKLTKKGVLFYDSVAVEII